MEFNHLKEGRQCFHSSHFQNQTRNLTQTNTTDEGFWFSFHKNYKLGPTYPRLTIFYWQSNTFTSTANTMVLAIRASCKFVLLHLLQKFEEANWACYQSTLISGTPFFSQWYFPLSGQSTIYENYDRSLQALLFSPLACSCILMQLALLAQIGELAHKLFRRHPQN